MYTYGVASTSRLLKITGFFCKRDLSKRRYSVKETYNLKEPTNRSHPIIWRPELWPLKYGAASVSRIDKIIGLFYKRDLYKRLYSAKETHNLIDPTGRSHPIVLYLPYFGSHCIDGSIFWLTLHLCLCHILCHVNFLFLDLPYFASAIFGAHTAIYIQGGEDSQLQIIFHKRATKCRSLLRNMAYKDTGSHASSPPCITFAIFHIWNMKYIRMHTYLPYFGSHCIYGNIWQIWKMANFIFQGIRWCIHPKCLILLQHRPCLYIIHSGLFGGNPGLFFGNPGLFCGLLSCIQWCIHPKCLIIT